MKNIRKIRDLISAISYSGGNVLFNSSINIEQYLMNSKIIDTSNSSAPFKTTTAFDVGASMNIVSKHGGYKR